MLYRKIKIISIFILFTVSSCAQKIIKAKVGISFSEEVLIDKAIKFLDIDSVKIGNMLSKVSPNNSKETIIVIEEKVKEEEWSSESNSHIAIIENTTGKITHSYFESSETNGWDSDAIFIDDISIDTLNYKLNASKNAFGIKVRFRNNSQPNPYAFETLSLFTKEKESLKKILDFYTTYKSSGEVNVNMDACYANFNKTTNTLIMSDAKTNGYYDIMVKKTVSQRRYQEDKYGYCNPLDTVISIEKEVLKFDGEAYKEQKNKK